MGCWNGTCGLTNLPIKHGDKILLFPIIKNRQAKVGSGGFCYGNNQYQPITLPLYGEYNDYGGIEKVTRNGDVVLKHFAELSKETMFGDKKIQINEHEFERAKYFNKEFDGVPKDIDELVNDYIERGVYANIGFMMVLETVYDDAKAFLINYVNRVKADGEKFIERHREYLSENESWKLFGLYSVFADKDGNINHNEHYENYFSRFFEGGGEDRNPYPFRDFVLNISSMEDYSIMLDSLTDLVVMDMILYRSRKFWTVQTGAGGQDENYDMLSILAKSVLKRKKQVWQQIQDSGWGDEDEVFEEDSEVYELSRY